MQKKLFSLVVILFIARVSLGKLQEKPSNFESEQLQCGEFIRTRANETNNRIFNGGDAKPGEVPFIARLEARDYENEWNFFCGGSIIDNWHILTAAHCVIRRQPELLRVWVGDRSREDGDPLEMVHKVSKIIVHANYGENNIDDIALLKLSKPIEFKMTSEGARNQVCLPAQANLSYVDGEQLMIAGWGLTEEDIPSTALQVAANMSLLTRDTCEGVYGNLKPLVDIVCAVNEKKDTCNGDSGGPLYKLVDNGLRQELVGITSLSLFGCGNGKPSVYTRVDRYLDWIERNRIA